MADPANSRLTAIQKMVFSDTVHTSPGLSVNETIRAQPTTSFKGLDEAGLGGQPRRRAGREARFKTRRSAFTAAPLQCSL